MSFIGATGLDEHQENYDELNDKIDANASYINTLVGIPDPTHLPLYGINILNPGLYGLVERAEVNIRQLQTQGTGQGSTISSIETTISGIESSISAIEGQITAIEGQITAVEGSISTIQFTELPLLVTSIGAAAAVGADALSKANKSLGIWDEDGNNNTYNMKSGNVGIGILPKGTILNNKLEVGGSINIPSGSKYKINNIDLSYNDLTNKLTAGTNISIVSGAINNTYTYTLPTAGVGTGGTLGGVKIDNSTITINNGVISATAGTPQVNSDWTQTNTSLKSFILNKPTAGNNISFANNTITNTITGSTSQNIIGLNANQLIIVDKPNSEKLDEAFVPLTNEPVLTQNVIVSDAYYPRIPATNSATWTDMGYTMNVKVSDAVLGNQYIYYIFNNIITSQDHYHSQASYTGTGNTYTGATRFKTFAGIAIGIDYGRSIYPERMRIAPRPLQAGFTGNDFINGAPKAFKIFASDDAACWNDNNHSSWTQIHDQTTGLTYTNEQYTIVNLTANLPKYRYYTMVVLSTIGNYAGGYMMISEWNMGGDEKIDPVPEGNPITHKTLNFTYNPITIIPNNTIDMTSYRGVFNTTFVITITGIGNTSGNLWGTDIYTDDSQIAKAAVHSGFIQNGETKTLYIRMFSGLSSYTGTTRNGVVSASFATWSGSYIFIQPFTNTYTLTVPLTGTGVIINNTTLQYLSAGTYTISVGATQSSVVRAAIGQVGSDPYPLTNGSTIAFKYSMTQRTQASVFYKKDGLIKYVPASGTNPSTGTWNIIDVDSQALSQFGGNLPFTRIDGNLSLTRIEGNISGKIPISSTDGNLPASRIDNLALSLGMDLTGVNGVTQIKLTSGIVVVQGNLYSTGVNYFKYNVWHLDSDAFERFYFQQSNTTYLKGHGTTPFEFRNGANTNICTISGSGGLAVASYLQGSGAGGAFRLVRPDTWVRMKSADETTHLDFAAGSLYAHTNLDVAGTAFLSGYTYARLQSVSNTGTDYVCVTGSPEADPLGGFYSKYLKIAYNSFTGFHRCYIEDELCNDQNIDIFKNEYIGRVVISTGKIKTDASRVKEDNEAEHEWYSLENKEGITIEDALPIVQLSRVKKDKRVYGVLGNPNRNLNNKNRIIVNGCGEGAICVANTNGNIENGDYIQTSDLLGYGEKQDDDLHRNYTIAKAVMDCTFELDNPNYECKELSSGVRVAMIACVYKAS